MRLKILYQNFIFCVLILFSVLVSAQKSPVNLSNSVFKDAQVIFDKNGEGTKYIKFTQGNGISLESFFREYSRTFNWSDDNEAKPFRVTKDNIGQTHHRYKQYYKGIELTDVEFILHEKNGNIISANGNLIHGLNLNIVPTISEQAALQYALADINAESYMWENEKNESHLRKEQDDPNSTMRPKGVLIISAKNFEFEKENFHLVYRFDIYAEKPLDRYYIDVDAHSGEIINKISRMQSGDVPGQGTSFYNGVVQMTIADTAITIIPPSRWHPNNWNGYENGLSWWCADPSYGNQGGYANCWYEVLDTDPIMLSGSNLNLQFVHRYSTETPYVYQEYDGFDGMNVRISTDNGTTWIILQNPNPAYTNSSLFSFGYEFNEGVGIPGWAGLLSDWTNVNIDLNAYAGQNVKIRFAFASDNTVSTFDGTSDSFSWKVDNILISNSLDTLFSNSGDSGGVTVTNLAREVSLIEGNYRLRQYSRGGGISTYDARHTASTTLSTDFVDNDTNFDSENARVGVSVHWGLENTYDYYLNTINRNSFDDNGSKYIAYAHYGNAWDNAMWDGTRMLFGDGPANSIPLVSIDVVAHELTHGVTQYAANLIYLNEFGALNESFSDIFGTAVEFYALGTGADWLMFDIRSMSDPKQFRQPDTYHGQYWAYGDPLDYGGVHTNSGVQNFWYYLLSEGGSGVNDYGHSYSVAGIGMDAASKISYRNLANYLVPTSEYFDARFGSMNAAQDLFGLNSPEFQSVIDAWNAVGVMKPNLVPTVGVERDTVNFLAEVQFSPDTVDISVSNYGLETLNISSVEIAGANFQSLSTFSFPIVLNYDESISVKVVFTPTQQGQVFSTLTVGSNDPATPNKTVILKGNGFIVQPAQYGKIYAVTNETNSSFINLNPDNGAGTLLGLTGVPKIYGIAIRPSNGQIYSTQVNVSCTPLIRIDSETGQTYEFSNLSLGYIKAIAFDSNDDLYGAAYNGNLYKIDLTNGSLTLIGAMGITSISSVAINPVDGQMWATPLGGAIYKIDKSNGLATLVGNTGFPQTPAIAFDLEGKFFGTIKFTSNTNSELISIDKITGVGTVVGSTGFSLVSGLVTKGIVVVGVEEELNEIPTEFLLSQNYPNPFNSYSIIKYSIPKTSQVTLKIFNTLGEELEILVNEEKPVGTYELNWNATNLPSGVYFYRLQAGDPSTGSGQVFVQTRKMILLR